MIREIEILNKSRKIGIGSIEKNKKNMKYDMMEVFSKNMINSQEILKEDKNNFDLFLSIIGTREKPLNRVFINYHLFNPYSEDATNVSLKIDNIYQDLKRNLEYIEENTDKILHISYMLKKEEDTLAIIQSYKGYELDKKNIKYGDSIYNTLSTFETSRMGIGERIAEKAESEYNLLTQLIGEDVAEKEFRITPTYLPQIDKTVYVIDKKRYDLDNPDINKQEYWETEKILTDTELLENLADLSKREKYNKRKMLFNEKIDDKDLAKIIELRENSRFNELFKDSEYFELKDGQPVNIKQHSKLNNIANIGILGSLIIVYAFSNNIKLNNNGTYTYDEKLLENSKYVKRALNVMNEFEKSDMSFDEFLDKPRMSNFGYINAYSIGAINEIEKLSNLDEKQKEYLKEHNTYLNKVYAVGVIDEDKNKIEHIENLSPIEAFIDLYDGNTSPEQRRLLELKLYLLAKEEQEKRLEEERAFEEQYKENKLEAVVLPILATAIAITQAEKEEMERNNPIKSSNIQSVSALDKLFEIEKKLEKEEKDEELSEIEIEEIKKQKEIEEKTKNYINNYKQNIDEISDKDNLKRETGVLPQKNIKEQRGIFKKFFSIRNMQQKGASNEKKTSKITEQEKTVLSRAEEKYKLKREHRLDDKNEPEFIIKVFKAMELANQTKIDYDKAKSTATTFHIEPNGDMFVEMKLLHNTPEKIYNNGMADLRTDREDRKNIYTELTKKEEETTKKDNDIKLNKELDIILMEKELKTIPSKETEEKLEQAYNELRKDIIHKELYKSEIYKTIQTEIKGKNKIDSPNISDDEILPYSDNEREF